MTRYTNRTIALVAVAAVGFAGCGVGADDEPRAVSPPTARGAAPDDDSTGVGPTHTRQGVPRGWSPGPDGARAAGISAVALTGEIARAGFITRAT